MRVLVAPDKYAGTLTAGEAATAIAGGWRRADPAADLDLAPLSDGGPGFLSVLHESLGGDLVPCVVADPLGCPVTASVLRAGETVYVEAAQACGLDLLEASERDPERTTSSGVGDLLRAALDLRARSVVVGLGGSATNDGGEPLLQDFAAGWPSSVELVVASDVDNPLLGPAGATRVFAPQKGAGPAALGRLEQRLARLAARHGDADVHRPGAGAAGGLGWALFRLGGRREPGIALVLDLLRLRERVRRADLVLTGEGRFDASSLRGKVVSGVAGLAGAAGVPCLVLAGQADRSAVGDLPVYSAGELAGSPEASLREPARWLAELATAVAHERLAAG